MKNLAIRNTPMNARTQSPKQKAEAGVQRISISLPQEVFRDLDAMVEQRGLENRSRAITEMISHFILQHRESSSNRVMSGMISMIYDESKSHLVQRLYELERQYLDEVISSMHVQLENNHRMEVIVVQGPVKTLREISGKILGFKGVISCKLTLADVLIPQVHPLPKRKKS